MRLEHAGYWVGMLAGTITGGLWVSVGAPWWALPSVIAFCALVEAALYQWLRKGA